jgi:6-phosphogluconolactonase
MRIVSEAWADEAVARIHLWAAEALAARGVFHIAVSGGGTPRPVYEQLARADLSRWQVWFADERCVPPDHQDSNYKLAHDTLGDAVAIHRMEGELDPDEAARRYAAQLPPALDVIFLGMGPDGHTCSLFPGHPALATKHTVVAIHDSPKPPPQRITLTPPTLNTARELLMLVTGDGKADAVNRALTGPLDVTQCPAQLARRGVWIMDTAAASHLQERDP